MQFSFTPTYASILPLLFLAPDRLLTRFFVLVWYVHTLLFLPMAPSLRLITCALSSLSTSCYSCGRRNSLWNLTNISTPFDTTHRVLLFSTTFVQIEAAFEDLLHKHKKTNDSCKNTWHTLAHATVAFLGSNSCKLAVLVGGVSIESEKCYVDNNFHRYENLARGVLEPLWRPAHFHIPPPQNKWRGVDIFVSVFLSPEGGLCPLRVVEGLVSTDGWESGVAARSASLRGWQRVQCMNESTSYIECVVVHRN